jgi:YVTN family beta-propeller protein
VLPFSVFWANLSSSVKHFTHCWVGIWLGVLACPFAYGAFINFETAAVHPLALSPDGRTLAVCNLPDNRVEFFDLDSGPARAAGSVFVGMDPVSVRFRTTNELWVVNHISRSISVVDVGRRRVAATLETLSGPADIAFAGVPMRAYVTCANERTVQVFDPMTLTVVTNLVIDGERPKAMAVSPSGTKVYVAIFESGNGSTILAPQIGLILDFPKPGAVDSAMSPYQGQNPPPNNGSTFEPPINPELSPEIRAPKVGHIVKKNLAGRWMDDNSGDWTEFVSGTNASLSGRVAGWDLPDRDLAIIDTATFGITYATRLMNLCMDVAVNPVSGTISVVGTDGTNERRFEPNLRGNFLRVNLALVEPTTLASTHKDLNPHLPYSNHTLPQSERDKSLGDPRGIVWNSSGTRAYVTGMGSRNLVMLDANGDRVGNAPIELGEGPSGLALDEARGRLYVLNRFSATVSVLDTASNIVLTNLPMFDPTPASIRQGRKHFYDTRRNSGLGNAACASCHPDGRMDRLAWDLGDPAGPILGGTNAPLQGVTFTREYHPMKGPMVTQTLQDIIGHEPFHWRADRENIEQFNPTFTRLLGRDALLSPNEMQEFKEFLASIAFPPNRFRTLDDTMPELVPLPGLFGAADPDAPLIVGDPREGTASFAEHFGSDTTVCMTCHRRPTGLGPDELRPPGPAEERHLRLLSIARSDLLVFKIPQLRNLSEKLGMDFKHTNTSRTGFGFMHDGRVDTLSRFLLKGFPDRLRQGEEESDRGIADLIAFLLCMPSPEPVLHEYFTEDTPLSKDVAAATGRQFTLTGSNAPPLLSTFLSLARSISNRIDLVAHGEQDGTPRGWCYAGNFLSDRNGEVLTVEGLLSLASSNNPLTFTLVPRGLGRRLGLDRDEDGWFDRTEIEAGFDPTSDISHGPSTSPTLVLATNYFPAHAGGRLAFKVDRMEPGNGAFGFSISPLMESGSTFDPVTGAFQWPLPPSLSEHRLLQVYVSVTNQTWPFLSDAKPVFLDLVPFRVTISENYDHQQLIGWDAIPGQYYEIEVKTNLVSGEWFDENQGSPFVVGGYEASFWYPGPALPIRFFRIKQLTNGE